MSESEMPEFSGPNAARMYSYYLGGKDFSPVDRQAAERVIAAYPETRKIARANRRFLTRAVWFAAEHGVRQFVELGAGMPVAPNVHEVARQVRPEACVVYVDNDPVVIARHQEEWGRGEGISIVDGDIRYPEHLISNPKLTRLVDFTKPVAVVCVALLHFIRDDEYPHDVIAEFRRRMVPGSYFVLSHVAGYDAGQSVSAEISRVYEGVNVPAVSRTEAEIARFFTGFDLVEPGLVDVSQWRPDIRARAAKVRILGGVGRKP